MEDQMRMVSFPKRMWKTVRVFLFMLSKGICKRKLLLDLNLLLKRGKIAGKAALSNLLFLHHSFNSSNPNSANFFSFFSESSNAPRPGEYEFSCSNTPAHHNFLFSHVIPNLQSGKKKSSGNTRGAYKAQYKCIEEELATALQMMVLNDAVEASPVLPGLGFGRSPAVRQLRVTDSPFPVISAKEQGDCRVDEAAEEFIKRFYSQLRTQSLTESFK